MVNERKDTMKTRTQAIAQSVSKRTGKKNETLLDEFKRAFEDVKHGRMREWKFNDK